jgi:hypothetical protein
MLKWFFGAFFVVLHDDEHLISKGWIALGTSMPSVRQRKRPVMSSTDSASISPRCPP